MAQGKNRPLSFAREPHHDRGDVESEWPGPPFKDGLLDYVKLKNVAVLKRLTSEFSV